MSVSETKHDVNTNNSQLHAETQVGRNFILLEK